MHSIRLVFVVFALVTPHAIGQTYKCTINGRSVYSDFPCSTSARRVDAGQDTVTAAEQAEVKERLRREKKEAARVDAEAAIDQADRERSGAAAAGARDQKKLRCQQLQETARSARNEAATYRYHPGLIEDANRRAREAEGAHFSECFGSNGR